MPYRDVTKIPCPRCKDPMSGADVRTCDCGVWVSSFAATVLFHVSETARNQTTQWWRKREPCPVCEDKMLLRGTEPALFQGCDVHGYWIDADTVAHTSLAAGIDHAAIQRLRDDRAKVDAHNEHIDRLAIERAQEREITVHREAMVARTVATFTADPPRVDAHDDDPPRVDPDLEQLRHVIGTPNADYIHRLVKALERRNELLEARVAELEKRVDWLARR